MTLSVLLVEDDPDLRQGLEEVLRDGGHTVITTADGRDAMARMDAAPVDVLLCDVRLPGVDGLALFRRARERSPQTKVILMTAHAEVADAVTAVKEGAHDYLTKPFDVAELLIQLGRVAEERDLRLELEQARVDLGERPPESMLVGDSAPMQRVVELVETVARRETPVLISGESGTGKELVARMLHEGGPRRDRAFVVVNCGALAENLIEAELFGHERGAFTGAVRRREGRFKAADKGTIFLDEIAELSLAAQAKLLRVLQEGTFEPIGSNASVQVDVRVISATHRDLKKRVAEGTFREDLYYRVNVIQIALPALRDRPGDLPRLLGHLLRRLTPRGRAVPRLSPAAFEALGRYPFPGNVRELSHALEHAVVLSGGAEEIELRHLPPTIAGVSDPAATPDPGHASEMRPLPAALRAFERECLARALVQSGGKRVLAAELLGISRKSLWEKLRLHGIVDVEDPR